MEGRDVPSFHVLSSCLQDGLASQTSNPWPPEVIIVAIMRMLHVLMVLMDSAYTCISCGTVPGQNGMICKSLIV